MLSLLLIPLLALPLFAANAVEPVNLFEARTGGYLTYRIPGLVVTPKGTIIAYAEARKSGIGDWADIDVLMRRSIDGGRTWEHPRVLADAGESTAGNPVAIVDRKGPLLHFLYCVNYEHVYYMRSKDQGNSFTQPVDITRTFEGFRPEYNWNVVATGPGHGIQLRSGRLVVPVWLSTGGKKHRPSVVSTIYSDDHGRTWKRGDIISGGLKNPSETVAVELGDGRVMLNIRNESPEHLRAAVTGPDGAHKWTAPVFDPALREPVCMGSIARLPGKRGPVVFVNPDSDGRRNLTMKLSFDEGKTWPDSRVLDAGISAYSDTFAAPDGSVYVFYERGGIDGKPTDTSYLTLLRIQGLAP